MNWETVDSPEALAARAAEILLSAIRENPSAVLGLPTGRTPIGMYGRVVRECSREYHCFTGVTTFKLPNTKILISLPGEYLKRADPTKGDLLIPDHWSEPLLNDPPTGNDTEFNTAIRLLLAK